jgi:hypothetical protein
VSPIWKEVGHSLYYTAMPLTFNGSMSFCLFLYNFNIPRFASWEKFSCWQMMRFCFRIIQVHHMSFLSPFTGPYRNFQLIRVLTWLAHLQAEILSRSSKIGKKNGWILHAYRRACSLSKQTLSWLILYTHTHTHTHAHTHTQTHTSFLSGKAKTKTLLKVFLFWPPKEREKR